jgi:hypothetical protein
LALMRCIERLGYVPWILSFDSGWNYTSNSALIIAFQF